MGMGDDDAQPTERMGGDKRQDGKPERFLKIAFGIVLSGKPDPHGLCGVIPFGCGGAFKGADGVPGFLGKNGEAEEPLFLRLGARFPSAAVDPFVHPLTRPPQAPASVTAAECGQYVTMPSVQDGPAIRKDRRGVSQGKAVS